MGFREHVRNSGRPDQLDIFFCNGASAGFEGKRKARFDSERVQACLDLYARAWVNKIASAFITADMAA
jgi:hypothetical protein